jgi:glutamate:Na+ symporter, ESS family
MIYLWLNAMEYLIIIGLLLLSIASLLGMFFYAQSIRLFQLLPFSLIAGSIFLIANSMDILPKAMTSQWSTLPSIFINIVFATLFLGKKLMNPRKIWKFAGPQVVFGQTLAWGQYVVGSIVTMLILIPVFQMSPYAAALIEISFEGGHGTAAGLAPLFSDLGFNEGADLALAMATAGIVIGLATGLLMIAIARLRKPQKNNRKIIKKSKPLYSLFGSFITSSRQEFMSRHTLLRTSVQAVLILAAVYLGTLIKQLLLAAETIVQTFVAVPNVVQYIPLFPLAMIGGILVQWFIIKLGWQKIIHGRTINFIGAFALEIVIISAIATMSIGAITNNIGPLMILVSAGTAWNIFAFLILAPKIIHKYWFERGIGDYGQSMGMTATGLLLMRTADPKNTSQALERFGYKQLLFEPIVGGGIFTAVSMLFIAGFGLNGLLILSSTILLFWLAVGKFALK